MTLEFFATQSPVGLAMLADDDYQPAQHLRFLDWHLREVEGGRLKRLIVMCPPRHSKSTTCSIYYPAWFLGRNPRKRVMVASADKDLAQGFSRRCRRVLSEFGHLFGSVRISEESKAAYRWDIEGAKGGMFAAGVGGTIVGRGADLLIIDDPIRSAAQAASPVLRKNQWNWYAGDARTRLEPGAAIILILTRWHDDDLAGRILKNDTSGEWQVIKLPAIAEQNDQIGRDPGAALWPERIPVSELNKARHEMDSAYLWGALFQQRPRRMTGEIFQQQYFRYFTEDADGFHLDTGRRAVDVPAHKLTLFATADLATSEASKADWSVACVWGEAPTGNLLLLDVLRIQAEAPTVVEKFASLAQKWNVRWFGIEKIGAQGAILQYLKKRFRNVKPLYPKGDKINRASAASLRFADGKVFFRDGAPWVLELEDELTSFPVGAHDDQVDAVSYGVNASAGSSVPTVGPIGRKF